VLRTIYWIVLILAASPLAYYVLSLYCVVSYFHKLRSSTSRTPFNLPPASILKPVKGVDHDAYENFASYCRQNYPEYELIFAVADLHDPVIPIIERLRTEFPSRSIRLITGVESLGTNRKVNSLCRLVREAKYDLVVMSDSDVRVQPDYLKEVITPFADPKVGAVTALYRTVGGRGFAASLDALGMCMDSAPAALVARKLEGKMQFAFGWTMATTKHHLAEIGGWEMIANYHSDDFELGNRIAQRGYRVELMRKPVWMVVPRQTLKQFLAHELRWSIGLKNVRPSGYWGLVFTHGLPWAMLAALISSLAGRTGMAVSYLAAYLALRLISAWTTGVWGLGDKNIGKKLWLVPLRDAASFLVWIAAFFTDEIMWRGRSYRVKNRRLIPTDSNREISTAHVVGPGIATPENMS